MHRFKRMISVLLSALLLLGCGCVKPELSVETSSENESSVMSNMGSKEQTQTSLITTAAVTTADRNTARLTTSTITSDISQQTKTDAKITTTSRLSTATTTSTTALTTIEPILPPDAEVGTLLLQMSLEEKIAQMLLISSYTEDVAYEAAAFGVGAVCLYANAFSGKSVQQVQSMTAQLQSNAHIPLLISVDEEGGTVNRISLNPQLRASKFLSPRKLFQQGGWELIQNDTIEKSQLLLSLGVNVNLAPVCDVPLHTSDYIYPRCFSMNASETTEYIRLVVGEMNVQQIGCSLKHFPGYGGSADTHQGFGYDDRPYSDFVASDFLPFQAGIAAGAGSVMVSHNIVQCMDSESPASLSPEVHRILRETLGFEGVIITDDLGMQAITKFCGVEDAAVMAVKAGNDMLCTPNYSLAAQAIAAAVRSGEISQVQIDNSVIRILTWKRTLGLL